jgi:indolepyruvate ferredoxin oxidoreductase
VAHLLTSPEKYKKDAKRYKVDLKGGDRIVYKHINRPHFDLLGMGIEFDFETRDWMLQIMKRMKVLRVLLPGWHKREKEFRSWYQGLTARFEYKTPVEYRRWVRALSVPEEVRGYRQIRYPKMEMARQKAESILSGTEEPLAYPQSSPGTKTPVIV